MSQQDTPVSKNRPSGSWRAVRSMAVPASVTAAHSTQPPAAHPSGTTKTAKLEEKLPLRKKLKTPGYFETPAFYDNHDSLFSKS